MALEDVQDKNVGRVSTQRVRPGVRTASANREQDNLYVDPLLATILKSANTATRTELNKSIATDRMRGYLQAQEGVAIEDVRKNAPAVEKIFGEGATVRGAQSFIMQSTMDKYNLDVIQNMDEYRKLKPDAFREKQLETFNSFLTGDPATDAQMGLMQADMFRKSTQEHTKAYMEYEQEVSSSAWYSAQQTKVALHAEQQGLALTPEQRAQNDAELAESLEQTPDMNDDSYKLNMANLVIETMSGGNRIIKDYAENVGIEFTAAQLGQIEKSEGAYSSARKAQTDVQFKVALDGFLTRAELMQDTNTEAMRKMTVFGAQFAGVEFSGADRLRVLRARRSAEKSAFTAQVSKMSATSWVQQAPADFIPRAEKNAAADEVLAVAIDSATPEDIAANVSAYTSALVMHNQPHPALQRRVSSLFNNPAHTDTGEPPANYQTTYMILSELRSKKPELFNEMFADQATDYFMLESQIQEAGSLEGGLQGLALIKNNRVGIATDLFKDAPYQDNRKRFVDDFDETGAVGMQMAGAMYDMQRQKLGGNVPESEAHKIAVQAAETSLAARTETFMGSVIDNHGKSYTSRMGLMANESPSDAVEYFINGFVEGDSNAGFLGERGDGLDLPDGYSVDAVTINTVTDDLVVVTREGNGNIHYLSYPLADVGTKLQTYKDQIKRAHRDLNKVATRDNMLESAHTWKRQEQGMDEAVTTDEYTAASTINMTDDELINAYVDSVNTNAGAFETMLSDLGRMLPSALGLTEMSQMQARERVDAVNLQHADAIEAGTYDK